MATRLKLEKMQQLYLFCVVLLIHSCYGRIHKFRADNDPRREIDLTTFGFMKNGFLAVNLTNFFFTSNMGEKPEAGDFGFTLDKTVSTGISPYLEGKQDSCMLKDNRASKEDVDKSVSIIFFRMDVEKKKIMIERKGEDVQDLKIYQGLSAEDFSSKVRSRRSSTPIVRDSFLFRSRRDADNKDKLRPTEGENNVTVKTTMTTASVVKPKNESLGETSGNITSTTAPGLENYLVNNSISLKVDEKTGRFSLLFLVSVETDQQQGLYNLFFHNCLNYGKTPPHSVVNFTIYITENNNGNYLSAGQMPLPTLYFCLCVVYFFAGCYWFRVVKSSTEGVFRIHYLMLVLLYVKSIALFFHAVNFYFIQKEGRHEEAFAILYYITHLMKGALLFVTIVLIGAGWAFVKHILSDRDKKIFIIVIPLQVLANVAQIIIEETEEGQARYTMWKEIFILVDLLCCGAILFPVVWSIRHLQEASQTDGKAAINLAKLKIFRHFYIMVPTPKEKKVVPTLKVHLNLYRYFYIWIVCYIYFTRIIVYLLKITVPFQYEWLDELFRELATFVFFIVTGFKFRPASNNPYLQVSTDSDDEVEMEEVLTQNGAYDTLTKVNVKTVTPDTDEVTGPSKRESSHDYD